MGSTDHGTQTITFDFYMLAKQDTFAKLNKDIQPFGIYTGGYLTKVSDSEITLSDLSAVIEDSDHSIKVTTSVGASITTSTLDSGSLSSAFPWIVLRWSYVAATANYMEIHALDSLSSLQINDLVVGKVNWSGSNIIDFDYSNRSEPNTLEKFLKVEATESSELYVRVRGGKVLTNASLVSISNQKLGPFTSPSTNPRIDLVYVDGSGTLSIAQGVEAASPSAPNHGGKLVIAQVTLGAGASNITDSMIEDARSFLSSPARVDDDSLQFNSSGQIEIKNPFGSAVITVIDWFQVTANTSYVKNHNLNSVNLMVQLFFAPDNGAGSPDLTQITPLGSGNNDATRDTSNQYSDTRLCKLTSSNVTVACPAFVGSTPNLGTFTTTKYTSGWIKIILLKLA